MFVMVIYCNGYFSVAVKGRYTYEDDGVERTIHSKKNGRKFIKGHFRSKSRVHIEIGIRYRNYVLIPMLGVMSVFDGGMVGSNG